MLESASIDMRLRDELEHKLLNENRAWMWSYDLSDPSNQRVSDGVLLKKYLQMGNQEDWAKLLEAYPKDYLFDFWVNEVVVGSMNEERDRQIGLFLFEIKDVENFLGKVRKKHLQDAIARGFAIN